MKNTENYGYDIDEIYRKLLSTNNPKADRITANRFFQDGLLNAFQNKMIKQARDVDRSGQKIKFVFYKCNS